MNTLPTSAEPAVSILVVAARNGHHLRACLEALHRNAPADIAWELVLVLNRAEPDVVAAAAEFGGLRIVRSDVDLGLAGGLNRARALARGGLLAILHDDTEIEPGWLEGLVDAAAKHPEGGAFGSLVLHLDGSPQTIGAILWRDARARHTIDEVPPPREVTAADYCGTAALLARGRTWDAIGGASEQFFPAYYVDVDLAMRIWVQGEAVLGVPASRVRHHRAATTKPAFRAFLMDRHRALFLARWRSELEQHLPESAGIPAGIARSAARWQAIRQTPRSAPTEGAQPRRRFDARAQERRHLELALALRTDWSAEIESQLESLVSSPETPGMEERMQSAREALLADFARERNESARLRTELARRETWRRRLLRALRSLLWRRAAQPSRRLQSNGITPE